MLLVSTIANDQPGPLNANAIAAPACLALIAMIVVWARFYLTRDSESRLRGALAAVALAGWVFMQVWYLLPVNRDWGESLPLHICDIAALVMPLVLFGGPRWMRTLLYFWAFAFTTHGFITPVVEPDPALTRWWLFWFNHSVVFGGAMYDMVVRGYRPSARDLLIAIALSTLYFAVILPVDIAMDWNYGFLGRTNPEAPTLIDVLGPWPLRLLWIAPLAATALVLVWLPWLIAGKSRNAEEQESRKQE